MIRAWKHIILPIAETIPVKSILEVGSEFGMSTQVILNYLKKNGGHLHAIDPYPIFDPEQTLSDNEGYLTFYQERSLDILGDVPSVDMILIDGDHNWYTVFHELSLIEETYAERNEELPLIFLHDTDWPYGRRDLYYKPENVPERFRHPYKMAGIIHGRKKLAETGGMNPKMLNALEEGGEKNGVMTGIEDYLKVSTREWECIHIPLYFGLTILATRQLIESNPSLASSLDPIKSQLKDTTLIEFGEQLRLAEGTQFQKVYYELEEANERIKDLERELAEKAVHRRS